MRTIANKTRMALGVVVLLISLVVGIGLTGCSNEANDEETQTVTLGTVSLEVPASWSVEEDETVVGEPDDFDGYLTMMDSKYTGLDGLSEATTIAEEFEWWVEGFGIPIDGTTVVSEQDGAEIYRCQLTQETDDGTDMGYVQMVFSGDTAIIIIVRCDEESFDEHAEEFETILDSVTVEDPSEPIL